MQQAKSEDTIMDIHYRHEWKHEISYADLLAIRQRLRAVAECDPHAENGRYLIRSLYFDNLSDKALREKIDGVNLREKFRIRYYNGDPSVIHLEKKSKRAGLGTKYSAELTKDEAQSIVTALASSKLRCMLSDIKCSVNLYWLRDDYDRRYGDAYLSVSMSATFYETMVEGTPDSGLPASKK